MTTTQLNLVDLLPDTPIHRFIVCGSRNWQFVAPIQHCLHLIRTVCGDTLPVLIHGGQRGADTLAGTLGADLGYTLHIESVTPAEWNQYRAGTGPNPGHARNHRMLFLRPNLVIAFKSGFDHTLSRGGTEHMCRISLEAGIPVLLYASDTGWSRVMLPTEPADKPPVTLITGP